MKNMKKQEKHEKQTKSAFRMYSPKCFPKWIFTGSYIESKKQSDKKA